ncbi:MAG: STAS domain-containing protein [Butyrivibrio sp.]|jgi:anti-sigma B factor antagonist|nr:STAS domain-containing protein [Butyrivibrio sp.]
MNIAKEKEGSRLTVSIEGSLDIRTAPDLSKALEGELDDVNEVYFDLAGTSYTSSAGLRVLLKTFQVMEAKDGRMVLKNVNEDLYDVLKLSGFVDFLEIEND